MKQKGIFIVMVAMMMITSCATQQQKAERKAEMQKAVTEAIASKKLHIDIKSMNTLRYGVKTVTPDFFLELRGDTLQSYLPYMGQAHTAPMTSPSIGLNFEERVHNYLVSKLKVGRTQIELDVKTEEDSYHYFIDVYDSGDTYIYVKPLNRDPISFDGFVDTSFRS
jgi:hypothetical protein